MIVIVTGSRKAYQDHAVQQFQMEMQRLNPRKVIHGDCPNSPDKWADAWAPDDEMVERFPAIWDTPQGFDKEAGKDRNTTMANYAEAMGEAHCVAVWDGKSPGTLDMIKKAVKRGIPVSIIPARVP